MAFRRVPLFWGVERQITAHPPMREALDHVHAIEQRPGGLSVTVATGFPWATGPRNLAEPLNSVLPAWDIATGSLAAIGLLAAERWRTRTGEGQQIRLSLSDVAFAMVERGDAHDVPLAPQLLLAL